MKKLSIVFLCLAIIFSFSACTINVEFKFTEPKNKAVVSSKAEFTETENKAVLSSNGTEYTCVPIRKNTF